ncbi:hypothetical protein ACIP79_08200 [Streptomyces sp. NPDC088747]|uniref:hypothetical protein n=1 Tax=Streptomyces sp. NPDC088747 TaxID=3365886 RepID=UPI00380F19A2
MTTPTNAPPDPLTMSDAEVDAILTDAKEEAYVTAQRLRTAEETLKGNHGPASDALTAKHLAELRATAEHAALKVPAAERRHAEIRETRIAAQRAEIKAQIRAEAASDLDGAESIIKAVDAFQAAVTGVCEAVQAHNGRIAKWGRLMGQAGIQPIQGEGRAEGALAHMVGGENVTIEHKVYRRMSPAVLLAVVLHRVLATYPREMRNYNVGRELGRDGELHDRGSGLPTNVHALIRRDA